ncbi:hypothetical protein F5883DRAFT_521164 [Diaporthe sp. PMI_573]|nr:hypothetical protein F5883DRAFT_521164 [Diaporthaceae sp. PMI_573]
MARWAPTWTMIVGVAYLLHANEGPQPELYTSSHPEAVTSVRVSSKGTVVRKIQMWEEVDGASLVLAGLSVYVIAQLDFSDKTTLVPVIWTIVLVEAVLITVVVVSRLMVRRIAIGRLFTDDALIVAASLFTLAFCGIILAGTMLPSAPETHLILRHILSYLRVFPYQNLRLTMYITMAITIGLMLASIPVTVFQCDPVRAAWDFTITNGRVSGIQVEDA